jgi:hypothetical protein
MRLRPRMIRWLACAAAFIVMPILAGSAFAQSDSSGNFTAAAALGGFMVVFLIIGLAVYVYMALALQTIANKTNRKRLAGLGPDNQHRPDVEHRKKAAVVDYSLLDSDRKHHRDCYRLDGNRRGPRETELVGDSVHRPGGAGGRARLSGLG